MTSDPFPAALEAMCGGVNQAIEAFLDSSAKRMPQQEHPAFGRLFRSVYAYLRNGGRRMHAQAMLLAYRATGGEPASAILPVAVGFQLYHHHTMVHDDIYDEDPARRGSATVHEAFAQWFSQHAGPASPPDAGSLFLSPARRRGAIAGWMQGKVVHALAFEAIASAPFPREQLFEVARALNWHDVYDNAGQLADVFHEHSPDLSPERSLGIAELKTGRLFSVCVDAATRLSNATVAQAHALSTWIHNLGVAYQLQDDLEDLEAESEKGRGRGAGTDLRSRKPTLLLALALENAGEADRTLLLEWMRGAGPTLDVVQFRRVVERTGGLDACRAVVAEKVGEASAALRRAQPALPRESLEQMDAFGRYFVSPAYWRRPLPPAIDLFEARP
jgi:geranylgeranyl diphosphate synthase type I